MLLMMTLLGLTSIAATPSPRMRCDIEPTSVVTAPPSVRGSCSATTYRRRATQTSPESEAMAYVRSRYAAHFKGDQGFSVDALRARRTWFTPCLYSLMMNDMNGAASHGDLGYLDWDPFTGIQDDASGFFVDSARTSHDTVIVHVSLTFPSTPVSTYPMFVSTVRQGSQWRIADFRRDSLDLARELERSLGVVPKSCAH